MLENQIQEIFNRTGIKVTEREAKILAKNGNPYLEKHYFKPTAEECWLIAEGVSPDLGCPINIGYSCVDCHESLICEYGFHLEHAQQLQALKEMSERNRLLAQTMFGDS